MTTKQAKALFKLYEDEAKKQLENVVISIPYRKALGKLISHRINTDFDKGEFECWSDAKMLLDTAWMQYLR
jgi:hypothetical protein